MAEFFVAATRRIVPSLRPDQGEQRIERYLGAWPIVPRSGPIVLEAARGVREHPRSFWDALVWATGYMNPFGRDFDVRRL